MDATYSGCLFINEISPQLWAADGKAKWLGALAISRSVGYATATRYPILLQKLYKKITVYGLEAY